MRSSFGASWAAAAAGRSGTRVCSSRRLISPKCPDRLTWYLLMSQPQRPEARDRGGAVAFWRKRDKDSQCRARCLTTFQRFAAIAFAGRILTLARRKRDNVSRRMSRKTLGARQHVRQWSHVGEVASPRGTHRLRLTPEQDH